MTTKQNILTIATSTMLLFMSIMAQAGPVVNTEYQAVVNTAFDYFNGAAKGNQRLLTSAFDTEFGDIKMPRVDKETGNEYIETVPLKEFAKGFKSETKDTWTAKLLMVDIVDDKMAMVKLDFQTTKTHYIDYLVMYKRNGEWKIVNKTFVANRK